MSDYYNSFFWGDLDRHIAFRSNYPGESHRLFREFYLHLDYRLYRPVGLLIYFQKEILGKTDPKLLVVTHICRDWKEQDEIYGENSNPEIRDKYIASPNVSLHMMKPWSCAADFRTKLKQNEREKAIEFVEKHCPYGKPGIKTLVIHNVGHGLHAHIQCQTIPHVHFVVPGKSRFA